MSTTNAGTYSVVITNYGGSTTSAAAILTILPQPHPVITTAWLNGTNLILSGTNGTFSGSMFYTLASTNLMTPLTNWPVIATNVFGAGGVFMVTNPVNAQLPQSFLMLRLP